jgi:N-acetylglucosaminyl-diphospho-decaprenol L-rhamnosyltransferase
MAEPPILSVIIVAYKSRDELPACLGSLPPQLEGRNVEIAVVNNSPGDGVREWLASTHPRVRLIEPESNLGFGRANNAGFAATSGECVLFLNPDTVGNLAALQHVVRRIRAEPEIGMISPKLVLADGSMDLACRRSIATLWDGFARAVGLSALFPRRAAFCGYNLTHLPEDGTYDVGAINGAFMLGRRTVFNEVAAGGREVFDEKFFMYGDDLDLCIRVRQAGYRIVYDGRFSIVHLKGTSVGKEYETMTQAIFDANRDVYLKHFNPRNSAVIRWKYVAAFGAWKALSRWRSRARGYRKVRPL